MGRVLLSTTLKIQTRQAQGWHEIKGIECEN